MNKRIAILTTLVLVFTMVFSITTSYAKESLKDIKSDISDTKEKLNEGQDKEASLADDIAALEEKIGKTQNKIEKLQTKIEKSEKNVAKVQVELIKTQDKLEEQNNNLNSRLRTMYKSGSIGFIDVILDSESISQFISNMDMVKKVYSADQTIVASIQKSFEKVESQKKTLQIAQAELKTVKADQAEKQAVLTADQQEVEDKKAKVSAKNDKLEEDLHELQKAADRMTASLQGLQSGSAKYSGGQLAWPIPSSSRVTEEFGPRICPFHGPELHRGMDIGCGSGSVVVAANNGRVIKANYDGSYGNVVVIDHGGRITTLYAHNSSLSVSVGQRVKRGQKIALSGSTGNSTGPHCHFEVRENNQLKNPRNYF
ncbi:MAG: peptidoglycan DD-metalloendopeptidase family protein [Anaerovoracaceae bacterium]